MTGIGVVGEEGLKESGTETLCQLRQLEIAMGVSLDLCSVKDIHVHGTLYKCYVFISPDSVSKSFSCF